MLNRLISLTEGDLHRIVREVLNESRLGLLTESQESKSISAAKKLVMQRLNYDEVEADKFVRDTLRSQVPILHKPQCGKFVLGVTRMSLDRQLVDANVISKLNSTLKLVSSDVYVNKFDRNLNGMSANDLISSFEEELSKMLEAEKEEVNQMSFDVTSNYDIVRIDSFEQAKQYYEYTNPNDRWCLTYMKNQYDSYTSGGVNQLYFCLRKGFENVEPIEGEGCPLDDYGLSMLSIIVDEKGSLTWCTCRWNHKNGGNDNIMSAKEVSNVVGVNFFEVFKPNNKWNELLSNAMQRLENGDDIRDIFDNVGNFSEGFAIVRLHKKFNFITQDRKLLSPNQWFDNVGNFKEGFASVEIKDKVYKLSQDGKLVSYDQWFNELVSDALQRLKNGEDIRDIFDNVGNFSEGFVSVQFHKKWNFITQDGTLLSQQWFNNVGNFKNGFGIVRLYDKGYNLIKQDGTLVSPNQWFNFVEGFNNGFCKVYMGNKGFNFITQDGTYLSPNQWFNHADNFKNGFANVEIKYRRYNLSQDGKLYDMYGKLVESINLRNSYLHRVLNESIKKVLKGNIYRR